MKLINDIRYKKTIKTSLVNFVAKSSFVLLTMINIYLSSNYLGFERLAIMISILSLAIVFQLFEFGIGYSFIRNISLIKNKEAAIQTSLIISFLHTILVAIVLTFILFFFNWPRIFGINDLDNLIEFNHSLQTYFVLFSISILANNIEKIYIGLEKSINIYYAILLSSLLSLFLLIEFTNYKLSIPYLIFATYGLPPLTVVIVFTARLIKIKSKNTNISTIILKIKSIYHQSKYRFLALLGFVFSFGLDNYIISYNLGVGETLDYNFLQRFFQLALIPIITLNASMWGAYVNSPDAATRKSYFLNNIKLTISILIAATTVVALLSAPFLNGLTGNMLIISSSLFLAYTVKAGLEGLTHTFNSYYNSAQKFKPLMAWAVATIVVSIPLKIFIVNTFGKVMMLNAFSVFYLLLFYFLYKKYKLE